MRHEGQQHTRPRQSWQPEVAAPGTALGLQTPNSEWFGLVSQRYTNYSFLGSVLGTSTWKMPGIRKKAEGWIGRDTLEQDVVIYTCSSARMPLVLYIRSLPAHSLSPALQCPGQVPAGFPGLAFGTCVSPSLSAGALSAAY